METSSVLIAAGVLLVVLGAFFVAGGGSLRVKFALGELETSESKDETKRGKPMLAGGSLVSVGLVLLGLGIAQLPMVDGIFGTPPTKATAVPSTVAIAPPPPPSTPPAVATQQPPKAGSPGPTPAAVPTQTRYALESRNGVYGASLPGPRLTAHYRVAVIATGQDVLTTSAEFGEANGAQAGAFSPQSTHFAAAYQYGHNGGYVWIGVWNLQTGQREHVVTSPDQTVQASSVFR